MTDLTTAVLKRITDLYSFHFWEMKTVHTIYGVYFTLIAEPSI